MSSIKQQYHDIVHTKLEDAQLRKNLLNVMDTLKGNRKKTHFYAIFGLGGVASKGQRD